MPQKRNKVRIKRCALWNVYISAEWYKGVCLVISIIIDYVILIVFIIPTIITHSHFFKVFIILVITIIFFITILLCVTVIFTNPGIFPRNNFDISHLVKFESEKTQSKRIVKTYVLNGRQYRMKFCRTCLIYRPLGCSHCKVCDKCIERYDHHCPWVGNCIGRNNYHLFFYFIMCFDVFVTVNLIIYSLCGGVVTQCLVNDTASYFNCDDVIKYDFIYDDWTKEILDKKVKKIIYVKTILSFLFMLLNLFGFVFLSILLTLHMKYVVYNITTAYKEKYFNENTVYGNPLNKGITHNIKNILCKNKRKISLLRYKTVNEEILEIRLNESGKEFLDQTKDKSAISLSKIQSNKPKMNSRKNSTVVSSLSNLIIQKHQMETGSCHNGIFETNKSSSFNISKGLIHKQNVIDEKLMNELDIGIFKDNNTLNSNIPNCIP